MKPIVPEALEQALAEMNLTDISCATIRQLVSLSTTLEERHSLPFVHLEMGNPGLPASQIGIDAEHAAMSTGVANQYPNIAGIKPLKDNGSEFLRAFLDIDIPPKCIVPTVGSMQATFTLFLLLSQLDRKRDTILFLDPGFPAQHHQCKILGIKDKSLDIYHCRGEKLEAAIEDAVAGGNIAAIIYSNPNNPAWFNLTDVEYRAIAAVADRHDIVVIEDHAYMGMDFRQRYGIPFQPPFVPTIARFTHRCIMLVSASKIFSYAGQRIALVCMTPQVYGRTYDFLKSFYDMPAFGDAFTFGVLYCASSGVTHSAQYGMAALLRAAIDGELDFVDQTSEYGRRAARAKKAFTDNGFHIVYDRDGDRPISDGFFFTVGYDGLSGVDLQRELMRYGVSTLSLPSTGSLQEGLRVCVSMLNNDEIFRALEERLAAFNRDFFNH